MITLLVIAVAGGGVDSVIGSLVGMAKASVVVGTKERAREPQPRWVPLPERCGVGVQIRGQCLSVRARRTWRPGGHRRYYPARTWTEVRAGLPRGILRGPEGRPPVGRRPGPRSHSCTPVRCL